MPPDFQHLNVLVLESRRRNEMAALVSTYGGVPLSAPALREVPLESNVEALACADGLVQGAFDILILLTGVGTRALLEIAETKYSRDELVAALGRTKVVPRGPKPLGVLRELKVVPWITVPEPNTWKELLAALDAANEPLRGRRIAVQEYGVANEELIDALVARGAEVTRVPVYRWALPEDLEPLRQAVRAIADGTLDVVLFTTSVQIAHLAEVADSMGAADVMRKGLRRMVVASIGPTCTDALREHDVAVDLEASHPKMGFLVREAAERSPDLLRQKRSS